MRKSSILYALLAVFFWSTVPTAFKLALNEFSPYQLILIASGVSMVIFFTVLLFKRKTNLLFRQKRDQVFSSLLLGLLNPVIYYLILFKAYNLLPGQLAQPINMTWPIAIAILSVPMLRQKISWKNFLAMGISFAGVIFISSQGNYNGFKNTSLTGVVLALASSFIWAFYWILNIRDTRDGLVKLFLNFLSGFLILLILAPFFSDFHFPSGRIWAVAVYIGFFEAGFTYIFWMEAMKRSKNNATTGNLIFLSPFLSLIFLHFILKETIFITTFIGIVLIIGGLLLQQKVAKINRDG